MEDDSRECCPVDDPIRVGSRPLDPNEVSGSIEGHDLVVHLLGTGAGMTFNPGRAGMSSVLTVGGRPYLVDAGPGAARRIRQAGIDPVELGAVFVTHQHADHIADLFTLLWLPLRPAGRSDPVPVYGPASAGGFPQDSKAPPIVAPEMPTPGIATMLERINAAYAYESNVAAAELGPMVPSPLDTFTPIDVAPPVAAGAGPDRTAPPMDPFVVHEDDRVRVTAILVPHGPVFPSYAYRFDTDHGSVTFSGDTSRSENLVRLAGGSDLLVHEALDIDHYAAMGRPPSVLDHLRHTHTLPHEVGEIATAAEVRALVLSHLGPGSPDAVPDASWEQRAAASYQGRIVVGHDLLRVGVDPT